MIHHLTCTGCGTALEPQLGQPGSLRRLHPECAFVRRAWYRCVQNTERLERYHRLTAAGALRPMAQWACTSEPRTRAAIEAVRDEALVQPVSTP